MADPVSPFTTAAEPFHKFGEENLGQGLRQVPDRVQARIDAAPPHFTAGRDIWNKEAAPRIREGKGHMGEAATHIGRGLEETSDGINYGLIGTANAVKETAAVVVIPVADAVADAAIEAGNAARRARNLPERMIVTLPVGYVPPERESERNFALAGQSFRNARGEFNDAGIELGKAVTAYGEAVDPALRAAGRVAQGVGELAMIPVEIVAIGPGREIAGALSHGIGFAIQAAEIPVAAFGLMADTTVDGVVQQRNILRNPDQSGRVIVDVPTARLFIATVDMTPGAMSSPGVAMMYRTLQAELNRFDAAAAARRERQSQGVPAVQLNN
jgi:hypothetical protein